MKLFVKYPFALCALLSMGILVQNSAEGRSYHVWFDDGLFDSSWADELMDWHNRTMEWQHQALERFKQHSQEFGPSKEDREALKAAREKLAKIKHTITEDDQKITIQLTGFEGLDKKNIKIVRKENGWLGTIALPIGKVEFLIAQNGIQISSKVEIKKEDKEKDKENKKERICYSSSLASEIEYFKQLVDISTLKAESVKDNTLTLVVQKQKEEVLPL